MTSYNFQGIANGQPWPAPWSTGEFQMGDQDVQSEEGRLKATRGGFGLESRCWAWQVKAFANVDWAIALSMTETSTDELYLPVMGTRSATPIQFSWAYPASGYFLEMRQNASGLVRLVKRVASVTTVLDTVDPGDFADGVDWVVRMKVVTNGATVEIRAKMWREADEEPDWTLSYDDTAGDRITAAGACVIGSDIFNGAAEFQYLDLRIREAEIIDVSTFDYSLPVLDVVLDEVDYSAELSWTGAAGDYELVRQTWAGGGEPWL